MTFSGTTNQPLVMAVPKGRVWEQLLPLLVAMGEAPQEDLERSRKLQINSVSGRLRYLVLRSADVPVYVQMGCADMGVVGSDVLEEGDFDVLNPLDLGIARCRLMVAGPELLDYQALSSRTTGLKVATKYPRLAAKHFATKEIHPQLIHLYGSMELAPLVGLSDVIVDLVDSGRTLSANKLKAFEWVCDVSSHLIVNRASFHLHRQTIAHWLDQFRAQCRLSQKKDQP